MGQINENSLEKAMRLMTSPLKAQSPILQTIELMEKVKAVYTMGVEDGLRQHEADIIIKSTDGGN